MESSVTNIVREVRVSQGAQVVRRDRKIACNLLELFLRVLVAPVTIKFLNTINTKCTEKAALHHASLLLL